MKVSLEASSQKGSDREVKQETSKTSTLTGHNKKMLQLPRKTAPVTSGGTKEIGDKNVTA